MDTGNNGQLLQMNPEAIAEVKVSLPVTISRIFKLGGARTAQFRLEMFNAFNVVVYNARQTQLQLVSPTNRPADQPTGRPADRPTRRPPAPPTADSPTVTTGPDGLLYVLLQNPTGAGTGVGLSASTLGMVIRLVPAGK